MDSKTTKKWSRQINRLPVGGRTLPVGCMPLVQSPSRETSRQPRAGRLEAAPARGSLGGPRLEPECLELVRARGSLGLGSSGGRASSPSAARGSLGRPCLELQLEAAPARGSLGRPCQLGAARARGWCLEPGYLRGGKGSSEPAPAPGVAPGSDVTRPSRGAAMGRMLHPLGFEPRSKGWK
ncbi:hypothetical protein Salat_2424100 [Sesamum alatum]|uniref:Uncharacterized protein n=1 Tax=Sesamum alatum TaxID=300844 RepID=A0AAE1XY79_9LAMI|nr:hypothetical protein Salat_2424100 [Sesamum alatum]